MNKPATITIATRRSCGSFFFSSSTTSMLFFPAAQNFAIRPEAAFLPLLIAEHVAAAVEEGENEWREDSATDGHHNPLPQGAPSDQRFVAAVQKEQQGKGRGDGTSGATEDHLR